MFGELNMASLYSLGVVRWSLDRFAEPNKMAGTLLLPGV